MRFLSVVIISCFLLPYVTIVYAEESMTLEESLKPKSQCELFAKKCISEVDIIQKRIKNLGAEINDGTKTYKPEEIEKLKQKLEEVNQMLDNLDRP